MTYFLSLLVTTSTVSPTSTYSVPPIILGRPQGGFMQPPDDDAMQSEDEYMVYSHIPQIVDHFSNTTTAFWKQRYQYNSKFYNRRSGNVFLMIGGERSISPPGDKWIRNENVTMMKYAAIYEAAVFQLEHRLYGPAEYSPMKTQTTLDLKLLTIDQAIEDIREFIDQMNKKYFNRTKTYWVTFGGSYSGVLSAFYREAYPQTTIGAVSTSSAVNVDVDYYDYFMNVEANYRRQSTKCTDSMAKAFNNMQDIFYSGALGRQLLQAKFNLCDTFDEKNLVKAMQFFFSNVYGYFQVINLYSGDNRNAATRNGLGLQKACEIMTNSTIGDEMDRVKYIMDWYTTMNGQTVGCYNNSYDDYIRHYQNTSYTDIDDVVAMRSWTWQACTELGYFQTTDAPQRTIFGKAIPVDFFSNQCIDLFGSEYTLASTYGDVAAVRHKYGGASAYRGTNVVFPNGSIDPWKSLGLLLGNPNNSIDAFMIQGTAHCSDMYPSSPNETATLTLARQRILFNLHKWIMEAHSSTSHQFQPVLLITLLIVFLIVSCL